MKAINNYIIIQKIKEKPKKQNGLFITDNHTKDVRYLKGKIISVGNLTEGLKENDIIYYDRHAGHGIEYADTLYHVIRQQDVVIVA
jgi:co-chaperonin GroES (HSP10)